MKISLSDKVLEKFPDAAIGVVVVEGAGNSGNDPEIAAALREAEAGVRSEFPESDMLAEHPRVSAWRKAYREFGTDPHAYRCSIEALLRRIVKGGELPHINTLVDLYNLISVKYRLPVGGEDLDKVQGDLALDFADGTESFVRLGGTENDPPDAGEVVWKDEAGVLCRRWNWREGDRTKLTETTTRAVIEIEALAPDARETAERAAQELADLIEKYCGGKIRVEILSNKVNSIQL